MKEAIFWYLASDWLSKVAAAFVIIRYFVDACAKAVVVCVHEWLRNGKGGKRKGSPCPFLQPQVLFACIPWFG